MSDIKEKMHSGQLYDPSDLSIMLKQIKYQEKQYKFNKTKPHQYLKRTRLLKSMFHSIGEQCYVEPPLYSSWGGHHVSFGNRVYANFGLTLVDDTYITIGNNVMFGPHCTLATAAHPFNHELRSKGYQYNKPIKVGDNCWFGANVTVMPGVTIGDNVIIGANSLVTKDIPSNVLAMGSPCRVIREITEEDQKTYDHGKIIDIKER